MAASSRTTASGGSRRAPGDPAANRRADSTTSSTKAVTKFAVAEAPAAVPNRYKAPLSRRKVTGSNRSPCRGETAARTSGSARALKVLVTIDQIESRVRGSAAQTESSAFPHPGQAAGSVERISTASRAIAADSDHW